MRIATWNINGLRSRIEFVLLWLRQQKPDVLGLQELKLSDDKFPHDIFAAEGYSAVVFGQKAWNGVAVLSREPAEEIQRGLPGEEEMGSRLLSVRTAGITYSTVYCPNGKTLEHEDFGRKLQWFDTLHQHLADSQFAEEPSLIGGDFNLCPSAIDCWRGDTAERRIFLTDEERSRFQALLDLGLTDTFRYLHPDTQEFSWWDYRGGAFHRKHGLRIDFLLASSALLPRIEHVAIDRDFRKKQNGLTPSDHAPVYADIRP